MFLKLNFFLQLLVCQKVGKTQVFSENCSLDKLILDKETSTDKSAGG